MRRIWKRILAFTLTATLLTGMIPEVAMARPADPADVIKVDVKINGVDINSVTQIKQNDPIQINVDWELTEGDKLAGSGETEYSYDVELAPMKNVSIADFTEPRDIVSNGKKVGTATVTGGILHMILTEESFLSTETGRHAGAVLVGKVDQGGESYEDGKRCLL